MANPMDRIAMLEADNRRLRIRIRELEDREEEGIRRNESLLHNVMENVEGIRYTGNNHAPSQGLVNDLIAQTETQRDKIKELERKIEERRRGSSDYGSGEQLRIVQRELDAVKHNLWEERRRNEDLQQKLEDPQLNEKIKLERDNEYLRQEKWKLETRLKDETRQKEEWKDRYEHGRSDFVAEDLRRRNKALDQEKQTLTEDLKRERDSFQKNIRHLEDLIGGKNAEIENLRSNSERLQERYHQEKEENEKLQRKFEHPPQHPQTEGLKEVISNLKKEVTELRISRGSLKSDLEKSEAKREAGEKRAQDHCEQIEDMAQRIQTLEHEKKEAETKLQTALLEKKEVEAKPHQYPPRDDIEADNRRLRTLVEKLEAQIKRQSPAAAANTVGTTDELMSLTARVETLEKEKETLQKYCDKYSEDNKQLSKQLDSYYKNQQLDSLQEFLKNNMERMTRDKDYLQMKLDDAQKEVDVLRENEKELKSKYESKKKELIRKERDYNDQVKIFEDEIDCLKIEKRELNTKLNFEVSKNKGGEKDFALTHRKKSVSFSLAEHQSEGALKSSLKNRGHSCDQQTEESITDSPPAVTPENLQKMQEEMKQLSLNLSKLQEENRARENRGRIN